MSSRLLTLLLLLVPSAAFAQSGGGAAADPPAPTIARLQYTGGDWYVGPSSLPNLLREIRARTGLPAAERPATVRLTDPDLWRHPYLFLTGHGNVELSEEEAQNLRRYLLSGGFLHADDCYGMDEHFRQAMGQVFPDKELVEIPSDHPVFHTFYRLPDGLPKVHEHDGKPPQGFGIFHEGRMIVFYSYESDIHDGWEDAEVHGDPPEIREQAFRMGVNLFLYALSQATR